MTIYVTRAKQVPLAPAELCITRVRDQISHLHNAESERVTKPLLWYSECFYLV